MVPWEDDLTAIFARKEGEELQQLKQRFKEAGRGAPCRHICILPLFCMLEHELRCLTCTDYEPQETPGEMGTGMGMGVAVFEDGSVVHLVKGVLTDGFFRSTKAWCGRVLSEEKMAVEIYAVDSSEELDELMKGEPHSGRGICRMCRKRYLKEDRRTPP